MFSVEGEYYCINGCLKHPICNKKIFSLMECIAQSYVVEEAKYYKISPDEFSYDRLMDGHVKEEKRQNFLLTPDFPYVFISLDLYSFNMPCRVMVEFFDNDYYGLSLLFSNDISTFAMLKDRIIVPFYQIIKPIYGNNGVEKALFSLNQIDITDNDIFNAEFMINDDICEKMGKKHLAKVSGAIPIKDTGIYFPQQNYDIVESLFHKFLQSKS